MTRMCECCGQPFVAQRSTARYCGSTCRVRVARARKNGEELPPPPPPAAAPVAATGDDSPLVQSVTQELAEAGKHGWRARHAIEVARRLSTPGESGAAALSKELDRLMGELLAGVQGEPDELDQITENVVPMRRRRSG